MRGSLRFLLLPALLVAACGPSIAQEKLGGGRHERTLTSGGLERKFFVRVPEGEAPAEGRPVVIMLHGFTSNARVAETYTRIGELAGERGWISVFPEGVGRTQGWNAGFINLTGQPVDDVKFIGDLLDEVLKITASDRRRVYLCGHSNGGFMTYAAGSALAGRFAALGVVAGTTGIQEKRVPDPSVAAPLMVIHGKLDNVVAFDAQSQSLLRGIGAFDSAAWWAKAAGITTAPQRTTELDGALEVDRWRKPDGTVWVELLSFVRGGHEWPGLPSQSGRAGMERSPIFLTPRLLDFFAQHQLPSP